MQGSSQYLAPGWPEGHPLMLSKQAQTRSWTQPVTPQQGRELAGSALRAFLRDRGAELGLPNDLSRYSLGYIKAGAYSQIRRLFLDEKPTRWMVELPADLDPRVEVIAHNHEAFAHFHRTGRTRFLPKPTYLHRSEDPPFAISIHRFFGGYEELNFGLGTLRRWNFADPENPMLPLEPVQVCKALVELVAILVYHFEPDPVDAGRGTALSGVHVNAGDFIYRAGAEGQPEMKLITVRSRCENLTVPEFVHSLIQLGTLEEMIPDRHKVGVQLGFRLEVPVLLSNPSIAFHGIRRGLAYRFGDQGEGDAEFLANEETERWLVQFADSELGEPYRPWVEHFLAGELPVSFGEEDLEGRPDANRLAGIYQQLDQARHLGRDYGDAQALELALQTLRERLVEAGRTAG